MKGHVVGTPVGFDPGIYERISQLARTVHGTAGGVVMTPDEVLDEVTEAAINLLGNVDHAGVMLLRRSDHRRHPEHLESVAATGGAARTFDALQHQLGEGPCFDAIWSHETVRITDTTSEQRWPRLMAAVLAQSSIRSMLSIQLYTDGQELGALNLYSERADGFDTDTEDLAMNLATHAAIALSSARRGQQFSSALASRDLIGQAKGIIMERYDVDAVRAFRMLATLSQESNVPVSALATQLVARKHPATVIREP